MLEIRDLTCGYDGKFFLRDINLKIESGELVGIIGPNGSGKTTLLKGITRVLKPRQGGVYLDGQNTAHAGFAELARVVAVVSQSVETGPMTTEEFVLLGRIPHFGRFQFLETGRDLEIARKCIEMTGIGKLRERAISELSGGERQLALIARALAQEPKLLLLDEPTTHLDITHQVAVLDLVSRLNRELGLTVVMVLHDLNLASEYCHRLVLVSDGRIHKTGAPHEVLDYKTIEEIYKTVVVVKTNPISSRPYILVVSEEERSRRKDG